MNHRKWLLSIYLSVLVCFLAACTLSPLGAAAPRLAPVKAPSPSDAEALAAVAGKYAVTIFGREYHLLLEPDGTYANLTGSGAFTVTPDQITFSDSFVARGSTCGPEAGVYNWSLSNDVLTLVPVNDLCASRDKFFKEHTTFKKMPEDASAPVEFVWRITGAPNKFGRPTGIAVDPQANIYVLDTINHRIQKFDTNGNLIALWGEYGEGDGQFIFRVPGGYGIGDIAVDEQGNVYVTDFQKRVQKFDGNGKFLTAWGSEGSGDGQFSGDTSIASDGHGNIYVGDVENYRIQKFDSSGKFLTKWGSKGDGDGQFSAHSDDGPAGVAADNQGNVYVNDPGNHRMQKFDSNGKFLTKWGSLGTRDGQFLKNLGVAVDAHGDVYVADNDRNRVSKFDGNGNFLTQWGGGAYGEAGTLNFPGGIAVDKAGNIYVVDVIEDVQKFRPR